MQLALYDIDYYKMRLNVLEKFEEGEFIFAKKLKFIRKYLHCTEDPVMYSLYSEIYDHTLSSEQLKGSVAIFHGFNQCQDVYIEIGLQFALNGFVVHLIDFEGFGFSAGKRVTGLNVERWHRQITSVLT